MQKIKLADTGLVSSLVIDYLNMKPELAQLYNKPHALEEYGELIQSKQFSASQRNTLVNAIENHYGNAGIQLTNYAKVNANIKLLLEPNTFTITTGHQLVLAGGPLFVAYKILTTVKICIELKQKYPQNNFIPVLWLASEDHDFEEISEVFLFNKTYKWYTQNNNKPVGTLTLEDLENDIDAIVEVISNNDTGKKWSELLKDSYKNSSNLSFATTKLFHELYKEFGLVIVEPNDKNLKQSLVQTIVKDILTQEHFLVQTETNEQIEKLGYKTQINAREVNFFYLHETLGRRLIKKKDDNTFALNETDILFTKAELEHLITTSPERFSPNVNLRPVYQETILPNLAYIGGPAEVAYWLQLKNIFKVNQIQMPVIVLRFMALLAGNAITGKLEKFNLGISDLFLTENALREKFIAAQNNLSYENTFSELLDKFQQAIDETRPLSNQVAKDLLTTKLSIKDYLDQKRKELKKELLNKQDAELEKVYKLRSRVFPKNIFQERIESLFQFECQLNRLLSEEILNEIEAFNLSELKVLAV